MTTRSPNAARRGFTLTELLVAVALVILLTLGVNQIFSSVNTLVGTGAAVADTTQTIRIAEKQLRDDLGAFAGLRPEDAFLVIRGRKLGDVNGNGLLDADETAIYLSRDDELADLELGVDPYAPGSRAITVRLDEMAFIAGVLDGDLYQTFQVFRRGEAEDPASSAFARIYYGHGLRPAPDPDYDEDPTDPCDAPVRQFYADGDFGEAAGEPNRFAIPGGEPDVSAEQRNRYAGDFFVLRHVLVLAGSLEIEAGQTLSETEYAPLIRDFDTEDRFPAVSDDAPNGGPFPTGQRNPRLLRHGRTDICGQSFDEVRRWLQGREAPPPLPGCENDADYLPADATAWGKGPFDGTAEDLHLWTRPNAECGITAGLLNFGAGPPPTPDLNGLVEDAAAVKVMTAVAGVLTRMLAFTELPDGSRCDPQSVSDPAPEDAIMDVHATFALHCSSLEIAWSDGSRWNDRNDPLYFDVSADEWKVGDPGDGDAPVYEFGDVVWFDYELSRERFVELSPTLVPASDPFPTQGRQDNDDLTPNPEVPRGFQDERLNDPSDLPSGEVAYDREGSFGAPTDDEEYLAIFPFNTPTAVVVTDPDDPTNFTAGATFDDADRPWPKPKLLRVRMTVHDPSLRLREGRTTEIILNLEPSGS